MMKDEVFEESLGLSSPSCQTVLSDDEREYFDSMCRATVEVLIPYIGRCVGAIYPRPASVVGSLAAIFDLQSGPSSVLRPIYEKDLPPSSPAMASQAAAGGAQAPGSPAQVHAHRRHPRFPSIFFPLTSFPLLHQKGGLLDLVSASLMEDDHPTQTGPTQAAKANPEEASSSSSSSSSPSEVAENGGDQPQSNGGEGEQHPKNEAESDATTSI